MRISNSDFCYLLCCLVLWEASKMRRFYSWICQHWGCLCSPGSEYPHLEFPRAGRIMGAQSCSHLSLRNPEP
uniref:Secreted protein n=1 Tax=Mus spicilegus TaxID=10103 RepID=A0A8C6MWB5_MUSSI